MTTVGMGRISKTNKQIGKQETKLILFRVVWNPRSRGLGRQSHFFENGKIVAFTHL